jgi:hypothetical protein
MNFSDLCAEVYAHTKRPDQVAVTESAVRSATLKAHQSDYYYRDIFETGLQFNTAAYNQSLDYKLLIPRWRSLKYLRKYDAVSGTPGVELDVILPEQIFDRYKSQKQDICYVAGSYLQTNSSTLDQYYLLGCYLNPDITSASYTSWIANDHPYAIVYDAAATVFKAIGKDEEAAAFRTLVAEQIGLVKMSNIESVGF